VEHGKVEIRFKTSGQQFSKDSGSEERMGYLGVKMA
jgi:hypothetical protein